MVSNVVLVLGLVAATVLPISNVAAARSVETTTSTSTNGKPDGQVTQDSCYYCGYISSGYCKCCVSGAKAAQKNGAAVSLVETAATMAIGGDASCYYCGYISSGHCQCCSSSGKAAQKVAGVKPQN